MQPGDVRRRDAAHLRRRQRVHGRSLRRADRAVCLRRRRCSTGVACDDGNACTQQDACSGGTLPGPARGVRRRQPVHDGHAATRAAGCRSTNADGASCDDADECTESDLCSAGACSGTRVCGPSLPGGSGGGSGGGGGAGTASPADAHGIAQGRHQGDLPRAAALDLHQRALRRRRSAGSGGRWR